MSDRRELARREAFAVWMAAMNALVAGESKPDPRWAELQFDQWWARTSRRTLGAGG